VDFEGCVTDQCGHEFLDRAERERHGRAAIGTDDVVPVSKRIADICRVTIGLDQAGQHVDRRQDFQGAVDRGAANRSAVGSADIGYQLFRGERMRSLQNGLDDGPPRLCEAVSVLHEHSFDLFSGQHRWCGQDGG